MISLPPSISRPSQHNGIHAAAVLLAIATSTILGGTQASEAHPHVFVDTFDQIVGDGHGHLSAIRTAWKFDALFSSSLLFDFDLNGNGSLDPQELSKVGATILGSAKDYKFFTNLEADGRRIALTAPDQVLARVEDGRLVLFLELRPQKTLPLADAPFTLTTYDPSFYVSFDVSGSQDNVLTDMPASCRISLADSEPTDAGKAWLNKIAGLGKSQKIPADGVNFAKLMATKVTVGCP